MAMGLASLSFEIVYRAPALHPGDLQTFLAAAHRLVEGGTLYQRAFVSPPELAVLLLPLTFVAFPLAYGVFLVASGLVLIWGTTRYAAELHLWPGLAALAVVLSPQGWWGLMIGQPDALLVGLILLEVIAVRRQRWALAGAIAPWLLLKPDVTWPVIPVLLAAVWPDRQARTQLGRGIAPSLLAFLLLGGWLLPSWLVRLVGFGGHSGFQPMFSGLPDLLGGQLAGASSQHILASPVTWVVAAAGVIAMAATFLVARRRTASTSELAEWMLLVPLAIWVGTSPYIHAEDALFAVPLALRLVASPRGWRRLPVLMSLLPWVAFPTWGALAAIGSLGVAIAGVSLMDQAAGTAGAQVTGTTAGAT